MLLLASILFAADCATPRAHQKAEAQLTELVAAVRSADYRGDRAALDRLDAALGKVPDSPLDDYRAYWRGFARWRRALNGFNETPNPTDLQPDLKASIGHFKKSLELRPGWIEARLALVGVWSNLIYLAGEDTAKRQRILDEAVPVSKSLSDTPDNPRALWIIGGIQLGAPPPTGGDPVKAAATMRKGVESSWREAMAGASPPWVPSWGGPENLMNLAYLYSHSSMNNRAAALAYAQGALTAVPEWHYVRDVLLPQIEAMPEPSSSPLSR
jgi:hypothetical protein